MRPAAAALWAATLVGMVRVIEGVSRDEGKAVAFFDSWTEELHLDAEVAPGGPKPTPPVRPSRDPPTIFVGTSAYRDMACPGTLLNAYENAAHPERLFFGVVDQVRCLTSNRIAASHAGVVHPPRCCAVSVIPGGVPGGFGCGCGRALQLLSVASGTDTPSCAWVMFTPPVLWSWRSTKEEGSLPSGVEGCQATGLPPAAPPTDTHSY